VAIDSAYATAEEYRARQHKTDTGDDATILLDLTAVSRFIETHLGRFFTKDAAAVKRIFIGNGRTRLWLSDTVSITAIKIDEDDDGSFADESALAATDYELWPLNAAYGPLSEPYQAVDLTSWGETNAWTKDLHIEVEGVFGWPAVPEAIKAATIHITSILRIESPRATTRISEGMQEAIGASPECQRIVWQLAKSMLRHQYA